MGRRTHWMTVLSSIAAGLFVMHASACKLTQGTGETAPQTTATKATTQAPVEETPVQTTDAATSDLEMAGTTIAEIPEEVRQAQDMLAFATAQVERGEYAKAFATATESYVTAPLPGTQDVALYAASMLTPIELKRLDDHATTHFERAILGQLRLNICAGVGDDACVSALVPTTADALETIGDTAQAERLRRFAASGATEQPVVAVFLPLSGAERRLGRAMLGAILQRSGIYDMTPLPFALRFFDTQSSPQTIPALLAEAKALGAKAVLGPVDIRECTAAAQDLFDAVMIGFSPNDAFVTNEDVFQFSYSLDLEVSGMAQVAVSAGATRVAAVFPEDAYASAASARLAASMPSGIKVQEFPFAANTTDLRPVAQKIAASGADAVYMPVTAEAAERIASFLAQENLWCRTPGTPAPKAVNDNRRFITCLGASAWAPVADNHRHKFLVEALYPDYADAATALEPSFAKAFEALYHRLPSVQEVMPWIAVTMLRKLPDTAWESTESLRAALQDALQTKKYLITPGIRQITAQSSKPYNP